MIVGGWSGFSGADRQERKWTVDYKEKNTKTQTTSKTTNYSDPDSHHACLFSTINGNFFVLHLISVRVYSGSSCTRCVHHSQRGGRMLPVWRPAVIRSQPPMEHTNSTTIQHQVFGRDDGGGEGGWFWAGSGIIAVNVLLGQFSILNIHKGTCLWAALFSFISWPINRRTLLIFFFPDGCCHGDREKTHRPGVCLAGGRVSPGRRNWQRYWHLAL